VVLDVAHNPHAASALADALGAMGFHPQTFAVCAMLADKDVRGVVEAPRPRVDRWFVAGLPGPRGGGPGALCATRCWRPASTALPCARSTTSPAAFRCCTGHRHRG
jgi:dihydrofolate synthase/folylpolyglutamate synthase